MSANQGAPAPDPAGQRAAAAPGADPGGDIGAYVRALLGALEHLPARAAVLFRGVTLTAEALEAYRSAALSGAVLTEPGLITGTPDPAVALPGTALLVIDARRGREITALSTTPGLREMVLPAGARLEVLAVDDDGRPVVLLREVEPTADRAERSAITERLRQAAADRRRRLDRAGEGALAAPERFSGVVGLDPAGRPLPASPRAASAPPLSRLESRIGEAASDPAQRAAMLAELASSELFVVVSPASAAASAEPMLVPARVDGRLVLPAYTARERLLEATGGSLAFTRVAARTILGLASAQLPVVLNPGVGFSVELDATDIATALAVP